MSILKKIIIGFVLIFTFVISISLFNFNTTTKINHNINNDDSIKTTNSEYPYGDPSDFPYFGKEIFDDGKLSLGKTKVTLAYGFHFFKLEHGKTAQYYINLYGDSGLDCMLFNNGKYFDKCKIDYSNGATITGAFKENKDYTLRVEVREEAGITLDIDYFIANDVYEYYVNDQKVEGFFTVKRDEVFKLEIKKDGKRVTNWIYHPLCFLKMNDEKTLFQAVVDEPQHFFEFSYIEILDSEPYSNNRLEYNIIEDMDLSYEEIKTTDGTKKFNVNVNSYRNLRSRATISINYRYTIDGVIKEDTLTQYHDSDEEKKLIITIPKPDINSNYRDEFKFEILSVVYNNGSSIGITYNNTNAIQNDEKTDKNYPFEVENYDGHFYFENGSGTEDDPFGIKDQYQLQNMKHMSKTVEENGTSKEYIFGSYQLVSDFDITYSSYKLENFSGSISNPNNYVITYATRLFCTFNEERPYAGLFDSMYNANVDNIIVKSLYNQPFYIEGKHIIRYFGMIAGKAVNSNITNCEVYLPSEFNTEFISSNFVSQGGICAYAVNSKISNCKSHCLFSSSLRCGGIVCIAEKTIIENCMFDGSINLNVTHYIYPHVLSYPQPKELSIGGIAAYLLDNSVVKNSRVCASDKASYLLSYNANLSHESVPAPCMGFIAGTIHNSKIIHCSNCGGKINTTRLLVYVDENGMINNQMKYVSSSSTLYGRKITGTFDINLDELYEKYYYW